MFKTQLDTFGNDFGHFWTFEIFSIFWKHFEDSTLHGTLGKKKFTKKLPKNMFRTRLDTFGNDFGHFWTFESFSIFWKHFEDSTFHGTLGKKKFRKNYPQNMFKTRLDTFGNDFVHFWTFENFSIFWKHFEDSTLHGTLGKKSLRKSYPKTCSEHVWTLLGTILGIFGLLKIFLFIKNISKTRPGTEDWAKKLFEKSTLKTC